MNAPNGFVRGRKNNNVYWRHKVCRHTPCVIPCAVPSSYSYPLFHNIYPHLIIATPVSQLPAPHISTPISHTPPRTSYTNTYPHLIYLPLTSTSIHTGHPRRPRFLIVGMSLPPSNNTCLLTIPAPNNVSRTQMSQVYPVVLVFSLWACPPTVTHKADKRQWMQAWTYFVPNPSTIKTSNQSYSHVLRQFHGRFRNPIISKWRRAINVHPIVFQFPSQVLRRCASSNRPGLSP